MNVYYNAQLQLDYSRVLQQKNCHSTVSATQMIEKPNALGVTPN